MNKNHFIRRRRWRRCRRRRRHRRRFLVKPDSIFSFLRRKSESFRCDDTTTTTTTLTATTLTTTTMTTTTMTTTMTRDPLKMNTTGPDPSYLVQNKIKVPTPEYLCRDGSTVWLIGWQVFGVKLSQDNACIGDCLGITAVAGMSWEIRAGKKWETMIKSWPPNVVAYRAWCKSRVASPRGTLA